MYWPFQSHFQCPKPVIAAIHGPCVGGGTNMVTFADIRYCTQDAWFQVKEAALGELHRGLKSEKSAI